MQKGFQSKIRMTNSVDPDKMAHEPSSESPQVFALVCGAERVKFDHICHFDLIKCLKEKYHI